MRIHVLGCMCFILICVQNSVGQKTGKWRPKDGRKLKELESTAGFSESEYTKLKEKVPKLKKLMAEYYGVKKSFKIKSYLFGDIALKEVQVDSLTTTLESLLTKRRRRKRAGMVQNVPNIKWSLPIPYIINTDYGVNQSVAESKIMTAIAHWEAKTCIRFVRYEISETSLLDGKNYIVFTNFFGCYSMLGRSPQPEAQIIAVGEVSCDPFEGVVIHEIGHALGFFHEQNRLDSGDYVTINSDNLSPGHMVNFEPWPNANQITDHGTDFDFGSIMTYGSYAFALNANQHTLITKDQRMQNTIGQRVVPSFLDIKAANIEYCNAICNEAITCQRGGIQDPNHCDKCICPDGFGGPYCELVAQDSDTGCSPYTTSVIPVDPSVECLRSPSYGNGGYTYGAKCSWVLQAPAGKRIKLYFQNSFGIYANTRTSCFHWVELKYKGNLHIGPRFCMDSTPSGHMVSESNEAVVVFRSDYETNPATNIGFELCYELYEEVIGTTTTTTAATTTSAATTTPKPCPNNFLTCDTFFNDWEVRTTPRTKKIKRKKLLIGPGYNCTKGNFKQNTDVTVLINLPGHPDFTVERLCVHTIAVNSTIVKFGYSAGGTPIEFDMGTNHCIDFNQEFPTTNSVEIEFTHSLLVDRLEIYDLEMDVCI